LLEKTRAQATCEMIQDIISSPNAKENLKKLADQIDTVFEVSKSKKHFSGIDFCFGSRKIG